MTDTLRTITQRVHPVLHHLVEPGALLADLGIEHELDLIGLQCAVEEAVGTEMPEQEYAHWRTVADVIRSADQCLVGERV